MKVLRYAPSLTYLLRARTMKQLSPWFLVCPLKNWFLDDDWTKQMAELKIQLSNILDSSSLRMSTHSPAVMQWKCSDMHHHRRIVCGLEPWSNHYLVPDLSIKGLVFERRPGQATGQTQAPVVHYIEFFFSKNVNPWCNGNAMKVLRYAPSSTYLLRARTMKQSSWGNPLFPRDFWPQLYHDELYSSM